MSLTHKTGVAYILQGIKKIKAGIGTSRLFAVQNYSVICRQRAEECNRL